ncbi:MAG TPA: hypothetical protein VM733_10875 [Thermoanaerobaculia bacterium]|nr:hypothetical protein [Thermoanaerobaculia bacterium]
MTTMRAQGRFSVDMDAAALGNGCSQPVIDSEIGYGDVIIGPAKNTP